MQLLRIAGGELLLQQEITRRKQTQELGKRKP